MSRASNSAAAALLAALAMTSRGLAQELEPRAYSASPIGANFALLSYAFSSGNIVLDPSIPIDNVHADVSTFAVGYGRTFALWGLQALVTAAEPFLAGTASLTTPGGDTSLSRSGFGDLRTKLSVIVIGSPALAPREFAARPPAPWIAGASVVVSVPIGQYYVDKVANIGANRWAFKPEVGVSYNSKQKLYLDLYAGAWLFTPNTAYTTDTTTRTQDPLYSLQLHGSYTFAPRFWLAVDGTWYRGGATHVDGGPAQGRQDNSRVGAIASYGFTKFQSLKLNCSFGASARVGQQFTTVGLAYQYLWF